MQFTETETPIFPKPQPLDMEKWQAIITDWEPGKETQKNYCERLGVSLNTFVYARSKLAQNKKAKSTFIPVKLNQLEDQRSQIADIVTIENPQGFKLHISSDLSLDRLAKIFKLCGWQNA
jgi:predicted enzyme involved in methoxymalonyl-ACP biosynthesis